jgi:hypothetical protein
VVVVFVHPKNLVVLVVLVDAFDVAASKDRVVVGAADVVVVVLT